MYTIHKLKFKSPSNSGIVTFELQRMLGCCGVAIIGNVNFSSTVAKRIKLFEEFHKHVTTCMEPFDFQRCKLLMSDHVGGMIDKFCNHNEWVAGYSKYNKKSGNKIIVYECDRENKYVSQY